MKSNDVFLKYLQDSTANPAHPSGLFFDLRWSALKKPSLELNFLHIFAIPTSSRHEKWLANVGKTFCGISLLYKHTVAIQSDLVKFEEGFGGVANYNYHSGICEAKLHLPYGYATQLRFNTMQQDLEGKPNFKKV